MFSHLLKTLMDFGWAALLLSGIATMVCLAIEGIDKFELLCLGACGLFEMVSTIAMMLHLSYFSKKVVLFAGVLHLAWLGLAVLTSLPAWTLFKMGLPVSFFLAAGLVGSLLYSWWHDDYRGFWKPLSLI